MKNTSNFDASRFLDKGMAYPVIHAFSRTPSIKAKKLNQMTISIDMENNGLDNARRGLISTLKKSVQTKVQMRSRHRDLVVRNLRMKSGIAE